jgi:predicted PurR-regulated permease PerM
MDEKPKNEVMVAFSLGALIGLVTAGFALLVRFLRQAPLPPQDSLPQPIEDQTISAQGASTLPVSLQGAQMPAAVARATPNSNLSSGKLQSSGGPEAGRTSPAAGGTGPVTGPRWSPTTKYIMGVFLFVAALVVIFIGRGVITMVIFASLLALFINPFIQLISRKLHLKWSAAVGLTYVLVVLLLLLIPLLIFPSLFAALNFLFALDYHQLTNQVIQVLSGLSNSLQGNPALKNLLAPVLESIMTALKNFSGSGQVSTPSAGITLLSLTQQLASGLGALRRILGPVFAVVASAFFTLFMALQMSLASNRIAGWYPDLIPPAYQGEYSALFDKITRTWISFLRGQMTLMLIIGVAVWLGNLALGVRFALLLGIIAGLLELIPSVGPILAAIPAVLLALFFGSSYLPIDNLVFALLVIGLYVVIQLLENQFIVPNVMGDAVDLPPLIVLIGALAGATAFGILGALLAAPVIATGNILFRFIYRKILEPPPLPPEPEEKPSVWEKVRGWASQISLPRRKPKTASATAVKSDGA